MALKDYGGVGREVVARQRQQIEEDKPPSVFLQLEDGDVAVFRILPGAPGEDVFYTFWKHTYTDPVTQEFVSFACPKRNPPGAACPVCDIAAQLQAKGRSSKVDEQLGYDMTCKKKVAVNVYLYSITNAAGNEKQWDEIRVWEFGSGTRGRSQHEQLLAIADNQRIGGDFADPLDGFPFTYSRSGKNKNDTTYSLVPMVQERGPIFQGTEEELEALLGRMHNLALACAPPALEDIRTMVSGAAAPPARGVGNRPAPRAALPQAPAPQQAPARPRAAQTAASYMDRPAPAQAAPAPRAPAPRAAPVRPAPAQPRAEVMPKGWTPPAEFEDDDIPF